jgi:hypothetical protein
VRLVDQDHADLLCVRLRARDGVDRPARVRHAASVDGSLRMIIVEPRPHLLVGPQRGDRDTDLIGKPGIR